MGAVAHRVAMPAVCLLLLRIDAFRPTEEPQPLGATYPRVPFPKLRMYIKRSGQVTSRASNCLMQDHWQLGVDKLLAQFQRVYGFVLTVFAPQRITET
jgi:hypothetical protein